jgi:hypothetical protein
MIDKVFRKPVDRHEKGNNQGLSYQTWKVVSHLQDDVFHCVRVDSTYDPMGAASPQKRTFKEADILKYLNTK